MEIDIADPTILAVFTMMIIWGDFPFQSRQHAAVSWSSDSPHSAKSLNLTQNPPATCMPRRLQGFLGQIVDIGCGRLEILVFTRCIAKPTHCEHLPSHGIETSLTVSHVGSLALTDAPHTRSALRSAVSLDMLTCNDHYATRSKTRCVRVDHSSSNTLVEILHLSKEDTLYRSVKSIKSDQLVDRSFTMGSSVLMQFHPWHG